MAGYPGTGITAERPIFDGALPLSGTTPCLIKPIQAAHPAATPYRMKPIQAARPAATPYRMKPIQAARPAATPCLMKPIQAARPAATPYPFDLQALRRRVRRPRPTG